MTRTQQNNISTNDTTHKRSERLNAKKLLKDFERQYIARNKDPQIYL